MRADDFQWLADKIEQHFPAELRERALTILGDVQEELEEAKRDRQRREIRELGEEFLHRMESSR